MRLLVLLALLISGVAVSAVYVPGSPVEEAAWWWFHGPFESPQQQRQFVCGTPPPAVNGTVWSCRGDLVALDVDESDLIEVGLEFTIYRDDTFLGKLKIVHAGSRSVGKVLYLDKVGQHIQPGDNASTRMKY